MLKRKKKRCQVADKTKKPLKMSEPSWLICIIFKHTEESMTPVLSSQHKKANLMCQLFASPGKVQLSRCTIQNNSNQQKSMSEKTANFCHHKCSLSCFVLSLWCHSRNWLKENSQFLTIKVKWHNLLKKKKQNTGMWWKKWNSLVLISAQQTGCTKAHDRGVFAPRARRTKKAAG